MLGPDSAGVEHGGLADAVRPLDQQAVRRISPFPAQQPIERSEHVTSLSQPLGSSSVLSPIIVVIEHCAGDRVAVDLGPVWRCHVLLPPMSISVLRAFSGPRDDRNPGSSSPQDQQSAGMEAFASWQGQPTAPCMNCSRSMVMNVAFDRVTTSPSAISSPSMNSLRPTRSAMRTRHSRGTPSGTPGFVSQRELAGERRLGDEREQEAVDVVEQRGHDTSVAAPGGTFVSGAQRARGHDLVALAHDTKVESPRTGPARHGALVVAGELLVIGRRGAPLAGGPVLRPLTERSGRQLRGEVVERGGDGVDQLQRGVMPDQRVAEVADCLTGPRPGIGLTVGDVGLRHMDERVEMGVFALRMVLAHDEPNVDQRASISTINVRTCSRAMGNMARSAGRWVGRWLPPTHTAMPSVIQPTTAAVRPISVASGS